MDKVEKIKKKIKEKIKIIDIPLYRCSVICLYETTLEEWTEFFKEQYKENKVPTKIDVAVQEEFENNSLGFVLSTGFNDYVLYVSDVDNAGLVAHEIFHAAHIILFERNYQTDGIAEPEAYLIEYLTNRFYIEYQEEETKEN